MSCRYVYVAGPLTTGDVFKNIRTACETGETLRKLGFVPFVPHTSIVWELICPRSYDVWLDYDLEWLRRCDVVFRISGTSYGADCEVDEAVELDIPVVDSIDDLLRLRDQMKSEDDGGWTADE